MKMISPIGRQKIFGKKIHAERVKSGAILVWDLWELKPDETAQGYQYLTVTVFDDMKKALNGGNIFNNLSST